MTNQKTRINKQRANYWKYTGNHSAGNNCSRENPYGYPLSLVEWVAYNGEDPDVKIFKGRSDGFGCEVIVTASQDLWESEWVKMAYDFGSYIEFDEIEKDEEGLIWGIIKDFENRYTELFFISEDQTELEMVQAGYVPINNFINGDRLWVACKEVAKG